MAIKMFIKPEEFTYLISDINKGCVINNSNNKVQLQCKFTVKELKIYPSYRPVEGFQKKYV